MSHAQYVALAYGVFAIVMAWDFLIPMLRLKQARRDIALRARRQSLRKTQ